MAMIEGLENGGTLTLKETIEAAGMGLFQVKLLVLMIFYHMTDAMEMMLLSVLSEPLYCQWFLVSWKLALITTALFLGMGISAPIWGVFADKKGRRPTLFASTLVIAYFGLLSAFSPSYIWFTFLRFIVGLALPGAYIAYIILSEFLPVKHKGWVLLLYQLSWPVGTVMTSIMASVVLPHLGWRYLVALTTIPLWLSLSMIKFIPESPEYCLVTNQKERVEDTMKLVLKQNKKKIPMNFSIRMNKTKIIPGKMADMFKDRKTTRITIHLWLLAIGQNFLYYGIVLLLTEAMRKEYNPCTGLSVMVGDSSNSEHCSCAPRDWDHYISLIIGSLGEFGGFAINLVILEWFGRINTCAIEYCIMSGFIFLLHTCSSSGARSFIQFIIRSCLMAAYGSINVYLVEVYSPSVRSLAYGWYNSFIRIGSMTTPYVAQVLTDYSFKAAFTTYGCVALVLGLSVFTLPETKPPLLKETCKRLFRREKTDPIRSNDS